MKQNRMIETIAIDVTKAEWLSVDLTSNNRLAMKPAHANSVHVQQATREACYRELNIEGQIGYNTRTMNTVFRLVYLSF